MTTVAAPCQLARMFVLWAVVASCGWGLPQGEKAPVDRKAKADFEHVAKRLKVVVDIQPGRFEAETRHGKITGANASQRSLRQYAPILRREMGIYSERFIKRVNLKKIVICRDLKFAGQKRSAVPGFKRGELFLDAGFGAHLRAYMAVVVHHELFHIIDWRDDWKLYSDESWSKLNPPEFMYGPGGKTVQGDPDTGVLTKRYPGFLNHYSTMGVEEDKAEVYARLITNLPYVERRAKKDRVLASKVSRMRELIRDFCPGESRKLWDAARKIKRKPGHQPVKK